MYSEKVMDYFMHPRNMGEIKDADAVGKAGNVICGDIMWLYLKVREDNGKHVITDVKFKTLGCAAAIATSSMVTEMAKNMTFEEALKITKQDVADELGGLPPVKIHCSLLATDALVEAIYDYLSKHKLEIPDYLEKAHERIVKEVEAAEKKYEEYKEAQKKILSKSQN